MNKHTKKFCQILIILELLCGIALYGLYYLDTDYYSLGSLKEYIKSVGECMYSDKELNNLAESNSISYIITEFEYDKQLDFIWTEPNTLVYTVEEAANLYETLLPDNVNKANKYVRPYIYTHSCYDVIHANVANTDSYYEIQATYLQKKSLHEILTYRNVYGFIYHYMKYIILSLQTTMVLSCVLVLASINIKYFKLTK